MELTSATLWHLSAEGLIPWVRLAPGAEVQVTPQGWLALSGEPVADFNLAYVDQGPTAAQQLRAFTDLIRARDLSAVVLLAHAVADDLAPTAQALGLQAVGTMPLMVYDSAKQPGRPQDAGSYTVSRVSEASELEDVKHLLARAFHLPRESLDHMMIPAMLDIQGITLFLTRRASQPVSTVMTTTTGEIIGIWCMGTPSEFQRQGAGRATLQAALAHHSALGGRYFYLGATAAGKPLYERVGFRTLEETAVWVAGQSSQFPGGEH